jgi:hypothetical protein
MKAIARRLIVLILTGLLAGAPGVLSAAGRRGANVVVVKTDGVVISGELIVVRPATIVLLVPNEADAAIPVADVATVRVLKRSKGGIWALVGFAGGVAASSAILRSSDWTNSSWDYIRSGFFCGLILAVPGFLIGTLAGVDTTVTLAGQTPEKLRDRLDYLAKISRVSEGQ